MTLVKFNPRRSYLSPWSNFDRIFNHMIHSNDFHTNTNWTPAVDINEDDTSYNMQVDLPGIDKNDIHVNLKDNVLTISGERSFEKKEEKDTYYRSERDFGKFNRCFRLPEEIIEENISASFKNGVLSVSVPKAEEIPAKELEIKVA